MYWRQLSPAAAFAAVIIVLISIGAGLQNNKFRGAGQDFFDLGPAPATLAGPDIEVPRLGLRYEHLGIMGIDVWRYSGHLVVFENHGLFASYLDLSDEQVDELGLSVPWRYHFPEGLIALLCLAELLLVARKPRTVRFALIAGAVLAVIAIAFRFEGLTWECVFPALLAMLHLYTGLGALWSDRHETAVEPAPVPEPKPVRAEPRDAPPTFEKDPFRAAPQPPPLVLERTAKPIEAPTDFRDDAESPKLLR